MSKAYVYLSHFLNHDTPVYGGDRNIRIDPVKSMSKGDSCNTKYLNFPNHVCTHIDFPHHFSEEGKTINDYPPEFWFFNNPCVLCTNAQSGEILNLERELKDIPEDTDFLILKTGFQKHRNTELYWKNNPGLRPEVASKLRARCPKLRVIGFDFISLSSFQNREIGRQAHFEFLVKNDILVIEDMNLLPANSKISEIICFPLLIESIDGSPVTVIGKLDE